jgi:SAM-dependent methyltransferase
MATWNELFERGERVAQFPERPVQEFVSLLERSFAERPLRIWDLCCGAGRHTAAMAARGHSLFASDGSPEGMLLTQRRLAKAGLAAETAVADMTVCPWGGASFHGVVSWDALHHNLLREIETALDAAQRHLVAGGWLLATLKSVHADCFGHGEEIEPGTFVQQTGAEAGVPHHYFDEDGIRAVLRKWELSFLVERRCACKERSTDLLDVNLFEHTTWEVLARKPIGGGKVAT